MPSPGGRPAHRGGSSDAADRGAASSSPRSTPAVDSAPPPASASSSSSGSDGAAETRPDDVPIRTDGGRPRSDGGGRVGGPLERLHRQFDAVLGFDGLPRAVDLPRYVAPLPRLFEDLGLRLAWLIALVNLAGTVFGFWYYGFHPFSEPVIAGQFADTPVLMWPVVPDSPVATLFIGLSLGLFALGRSNEVINALAFFGCIKLGAWTPFVQLVIEGPATATTPGVMIPTWLFHFLIWSHLAMVAEAFLIHRYSAFPVGAVAVAAAWYLGNDVVDYFVPILGAPHHTQLIAEAVATPGAVTHAIPAHDLAAAAAVTLTVAATFLALATRVAKIEAGGRRPDRTR